MQFSMLGGRAAPAVSLVAAAVMGVLGCAAAIAADAPAKAAPAKHTSPMPEDFSGTWMHDMAGGNLSARDLPTDKEFKLRDGTVIPLRPEAEKLYRQRVAMGMTDHPFASTAAKCLPIGVPGDMMGAPYPVQFVQRPDFIALLIEEGWQFRAIYMNGKHPDEVVPSFLGHSIGHWEGKTLVVDTVALRDDTTLSFNGLPHSTSMRVVERFTRTSPNTFEDKIEINDPVTYYKPFTFTSIFKKAHEDMIEYICEDARIEVNAEGGQTYAAPKQ